MKRPLIILTFPLKQQQQQQENADIFAEHFIF